MDWVIGIWMMKISQVIRFEQQINGEKMAHVSEYPGDDFASCFGASKAKPEVAQW